MFFVLLNCSTTAQHALYQGPLKLRIGMDVKSVCEVTDTAESSTDLFKYVGLVRPVHDILAESAASSACSLRMVFLQEVDMQSLSGWSNNRRSHCDPSADQEAPTQAAPRRTYISLC